MLKTTFEVSQQLTDRANSAPILGHCPHCKWLGMMPEPHHPECPQRQGPAPIFFRYGLDSSPFNLFTNVNARNN
jgi:hypothetical protein